MISGRNKQKLEAAYENDGIAEPDSEQFRVIETAQHSICSIDSPGEYSDAVDSFSEAHPQKDWDALIDLMTAEKVNSQVTHIYGIYDSSGEIMGIAGTNAYGEIRARPCEFGIPKNQVEKIRQALVSAFGEARILYELE